MNLYTTHKHKAGKAMMVNGNVYQVGPDCVARDVKQEDAEVLLQNTSWMDESKRPVGPSDDVKAKREAWKAEQAAKAAERPSQDATKPSIEPMLIAAEERKLAPEPKSDPEPEVETEDEWPDPSEDLDIEKLREMADAYEVEYGDRTTKKTLVNKLTKVMYEE